MARFRKVWWKWSKLIFASLCVFFYLSPNRKCCKHIYYKEWNLKVIEVFYIPKMQPFFIPGTSCGSGTWWTRCATWPRSGRPGSTRQSCSTSTWAVSWNALWREAATSPAPTTCARWIVKICCQTFIHNRFALRNKRVVSSQLPFIFAIFNANLSH